MLLLVLKAAPGAVAVAQAIATGTAIPIATAGKAFALELQLVTNRRSTLNGNNRVVQLLVGQWGMSSANLSHPLPKPICMFSCLCYCLGVSSTHCTRCA